MTGLARWRPDPRAIEEAGRSLSRWLAGEPSYLRELQWLRPSAGGEVLVMPECFRVEVLG